MESTHELSRLTKSAVLDHKDEAGLAATFLQSAAYSGAEAPLRAVAQVSDHLTGYHADATLQSGFKAIGVEQPKPAEFGTSKWMVQQVGGAVGMMVPFLALRAGIKSAGVGLLGEQAVNGSLELGSQSLTRVAAREAALSGATGLVYGAVFSPSKESNVGTSNFLADRAKNGLADMTTFAALSMVNPFIAKGMDSAAAAAESSNLLPALAKAPLGAALRFPLVTGMLSGVPAGLVSAETNALKDGRALPTADEVKQSIGSMAFVGGALGTASWLLERAATPQETQAQAYEREVAELRARAEAARQKAAESTEPVTTSGPVLLKTDANGDLVLQGLVEQAMRRMAEQKQGRSAEVVPEEALMDRLAKSTVTKSGGTAAPEEKVADAPKPANPNLAASGDPNLPGLEIVLGASGAETTAHAGFLQALEDNHVPVGRVTGVSGGSLVATLYANHYSAAQIKDILLSDQFRYPSMNVLARCFHVMDPWNLYPYAMDFKPWLQDFVDTYHLKPQPNLRIVAADSETHAPIVFEGTNYDLPTALAASTAATPALGLKPVQINGRTAIDGFYYHPIPAALSQSPALVSKIGFVKDFPKEPLTPWDYYMHLKEMSYYKELSGRYPDPPGHIIAQTGFPDVATTTFSLSREMLEKLVEHGREATNERLQQPDAIKAIEAAKKAAAQK